MLSERLKIAMAHADIKQAHLARACNVKPSSVNGWLSGKAKYLRGENLLLAAKALGVREEWLATGKGPMLQNGEPVSMIAEPADSYELIPPGEGYTRIDIQPVNVVELVNLSELLSSPAMASSSANNGRPRTFGLRVQDDTNEPDLAFGMIVEINMDREPKSGDFVLAWPEVGALPTIKQLVKDGAQTYLKPANSRYPIIPAPAMQIIGVIQKAIKEL